MPWQNSTIGGPGVMQARAILRLDIEDLENGEARSNIAEEFMKEELLIETDFLIYPNPSTGSVNIKAIDGNDITKVRIYDLNGKLIYSATNYLTNEIKLEIKLIEGMYIIEISSRLITEHKKLVISKE